MLNSSTVATPSLKIYELHFFSQDLRTAFLHL